VAENRNGGTAFSEALHIEFLLDPKRLIGCMGGRESTYSRMWTGLYYELIRLTMKTANNLSWKSSTMNVHYTAKQQTHHWSAKPFLVYYTKPFCCSSLRHCATNRKVAGSIPDGVIRIIHWHNPSGRTMALGLTLPLTEMSTRNISWG